jgi:hypothetical protein
MLTTTPSLADRFTWLFDGLCKAIGADAHKRRMEAALAWAIWNRVRLLGDRLIALIARVRAGKLPMRRTAGAGVKPSAEPRPAAAARAPSLLPREFGWIRRVLPQTTQYAGVLSYLLDDPDVATLVEKTPQTGRILRPLCHLLGVKTPEFLQGRAGLDAAPSQTPEAPVAAEPPPTAEAPPQQPPSPARAQAPTVGWYQRPGGLYWDGRRWQWS